MESKAKKLCMVEFPELPAGVGRVGLTCQMVPVLVKDILRKQAFQEYGPMLVRLTGMLKDDDQVFVTIHEAVVEKNRTLRRGGIHIDGNYFLTGELTGAWRVGGYWGTDREFSRHGGMIIVSNTAHCKAWLGEFEGQPGYGGSCDHMVDQLTSKEEILMEPNQAYLTNSTCVHESLPVEETVFRRMVRITLPADKVLEF